MSVHVCVACVFQLIKKRIRAFSGYVLVKEHAELAEEKLQRFDTATLKAVAHMLEIGESGTKAKLIERIIGQSPPTLLYSPFWSCASR